MYIRICLSIYLFIKCTHKAHGSQTRVLDSLGLRYREFFAIMWVLNIKPKSSESAVSAYNS